MDTPDTREALVIGCGAMAIVTIAVFTFVMLAWGVYALAGAFQS